ncbi:MAG: hypothetical protein N3G19_02085 [Candidatus Pacearchaeota archaeon]|nr:hypothetical protein [Candidatus Pacearchaeota archaeon]
MKNAFLLLLLITLLVALSFYTPHVSAGTQHGVNGMVNNASDGTDANGAAVTFNITRNNVSYCILNDVVGVTGNSKQANWYAQDIGNCQQQWKENDTVYIYIFKDANHTANTSVKLSKSGNDQAPTVNLSSPQFCGDMNCTGNETCLNCPQDCVPICNNNTICEPIPDLTNDSTRRRCENVTNCIDCRCNPPNGICEAEYGENCTICPFDCHCPDGLCQLAFNETSATCPQDCKCGNGVCENITGLCFNFTETSLNCPSDCVGCICGDDICQAECGENVVSCCQDCCADCDHDGICDLGETFANCPDCVIYCGNLICEPDKNETQENCPIDCAFCGNNICEPEKGETWQNCPDCYAAKCGDKICELAETNKNCCKDCPCLKKGFNLGPVFFGRVENCIKNRCIPSCCLGFCWGIYIETTFGICWYYLVVLAIIIVLIIILKKKKPKLKEKKEKR